MQQQNVSCLLSPVLCESDSMYHVTSSFPVLFTLILVPSDTPASTTSSTRMHAAIVFKRQQYFTCLFLSLESSVRSHLIFILSLSLYLSLYPFPQNHRILPRMSKLLDLMDVQRTFPGHLHIQVPAVTISSALWADLLSLSRLTLFSSSLRKLTNRQLYYSAQGRLIVRQRSS